MKNTQKYISGLDIQNDYMTVAQYDPDEHVVTAVAIQPMERDEGKDRLEAGDGELDALMDRLRLSRGQVNCSLPGDYAIVKKVPVDPEEKSIDNALTWELGQHILGSVDEYLFDYEPCGKSADGLDEYLLVAYRRENIDRLTGLLKRRKLTTGIVDIDLFTLINVFEANYPEYCSQPVILLHAETEKAKIVMTHHGKYIDHECFYYDPQIDPAAFAMLLNAQKKRLCSTATLSGGGESIPVFASGGLFVREGFLENAASAAMNIALLHPFRKIGCRIGVDNERLSTYIAQLSLAVGLALRGDE